MHIPILNDDCFENFVQSFNITLSSEQECVNLETTELQVYIVDDEGTYCSLSVSSTKSSYFASYTSTSMKT